jgi:hypothetical protein
LKHVSSFDDFWGEFQERFSRTPVWLPGTSMALGDIGVIDRRGYIQIARLSDFGISFGENPVSVESEYTVTSASARTEDFVAKAAGSDPSGALSSADAGMRVSFSAAGGFVVRAMKVQGSRIPDVWSVEEQIRRKQAKKPFWNREWIYVQEVVSAEPCIMIVSKASGAHATVRASVTGGLTTFVQLLAAGSALNLSEQSSIGQYIATRARTPFMWRGRWQGGRLKRRFVDRGPEDEFEDGAAQQLYGYFDEPAAFERDLDDREVRPLVSDDANHQPHERSVSEPPPVVSRGSIS